MFGLPQYIHVNIAYMYTVAWNVERYQLSFSHSPNWFCSSNGGAPLFQRDVFVPKAERVALEHKVGGQCSFELVVVEDHRRKLEVRPQAKNVKMLEQDVM